MPFAAYDKATNVMISFGGEYVETEQTGVVELTVGQVEQLNALHQQPAYNQAQLDAQLRSQGKHPGDDPPRPELPPGKLTHDQVIRAFGDLDLWKGQKAKHRQRLKKARDEIYYARPDVQAALNRKITFTSFDPVEWEAT